MELEKVARDVEATSAKITDFVKRHAVVCIVLTVAAFTLWYALSAQSEVNTKYNIQDKLLSRCIDSTGRVTDQARFDRVADEQSALERQKQMIEPISRLAWGIVIIVFTILLTQIVLFCTTRIKFLESYKVYRGADGIYDATEQTNVVQFMSRVFLSIMAMLTLLLIFLK